MNYSVDSNESEQSPNAMNRQRINKPIKNCFSCLQLLLSLCQSMLNMVGEQTGKEREQNVQRLKFCNIWDRTEIHATNVVCSDFFTRRY